jgi:membrane-bound lytic murein transglycosylase C
MKIKMITLVISLSLSGFVTSTDIDDFQRQNMDKEDPFTELNQAMETMAYEGSDAEMLEFEQWKKEYLADYQKFRQEYFQKVDDIRDNLLSLWGDAEVSSQEEVVDYSEDKTIKTVLDFENNEIRISVLHEAEQEVNTADVAIVLNTQASKGQVLEQLVGKKINKTLVSELVENAKKEESFTKISTNKEAVLNKEIELIEQQAQAQKNQIEKIIDQLDIDDNEKSISQEQLEQKNTEKSIAEQKKQIENETQKRIAVLKAQTAKLDSNNVKKDAL